MVRNWTKKVIAIVIEKTSIYEISVQSKKENFLTNWSYLDSLSYQGRKGQTMAINLLYRSYLPRNICNLEYKIEHYA